MNESSGGARPQYVASFRLQKDLLELVENLAQHNGKAGQTIGKVLFMNRREGVVSVGSKNYRMSMVPNTDEANHCRLKDDKCIKMGPILHKVRCQEEVESDFLDCWSLENNLKKGALVTKHQKRKLSQPQNPPKKRAKLNPIHEKTNLKQCKKKSKVEILSDEDENDQAQSTPSMVANFHPLESEPSETPTEDPYVEIIDLITQILAVKSETLRNLRKRVNRLLGGVSKNLSHQEFKVLADKVALNVTKLDRECSLRPSVFRKLDLEKLQNSKYLTGHEICSVVARMQPKADFQPRSNPGPISNPTATQVQTAVVQNKLEIKKNVPRSVAYSIHKKSSKSRIKSSVKTAKPIVRKRKLKTSSSKRGRPQKKKKASTLRNPFDSYCTLWLMM